LVIDPTVGAVTHLVVGHEMLGRRVLVPLTAVRSSSPDAVDVQLTEADFDECELFDEPAFNVPGDGYQPPGGALEPGAYFLEPFASPLDGWALADHERIPKGEITIRRGDEVVASNGENLGHVDELLVDPSDGHVTHVVLREGHIFRHDDDVVVPIGGATFGEGRVALGLDVEQVQALPRIPVKRHGHVRQGGA